MESSRPHCVVTGTLSFILLISSLAGIAPLKFEYGSYGWKVKASKIASIYGKMLVIIFCVLPLLSIIFSLTMSPTPFYLRTTSDRTVTIFTLILASSVGLVGSFSASKRMCHMIKYLAQINKIIVELNQYCKLKKPKEWKIFIYVTSVLIFSIITVFMASITFINQIAIFDDDTAQIQVLYIFYYIMIEYIQLISIQFYLVCFSVLVSIRLLNECLRFIITDLHANHNAKTLSKTAKVLSRLASIYSSLCAVVQYVNKSYGYLILQLLVVFLMYLIITPYNILSKILKSKISDMTILTEFLWFLFHSCNLFMIVEPCHQTIEEVSATKILISKAMCQVSLVSTSQHAINTELDLFYEHIMMRDVCYNPLKVVKIDRTLILSITSSITTYLVIVLSF